MKRWWFQPAALLLAYMFFQAQLWIPLLVVLIPLAYIRGNRKAWRDNGLALSKTGARRLVTGRK